MEIELKDEIILFEEKEESADDDKISGDKENIEIEFINDGDLHTTKKRRKKRRTKEELNGRNFVCTMCEKAYLSYPALTNHRKAKHPNFEFHQSILIDEKKRRGRPKKNLFGNFINDYENKMKNLLEYEPRKNTNNNHVDIVKCVNVILQYNPILKTELTNTQFLLDIIKMNSNNKNIQEAGEVNETQKMSKEIEVSMDKAFTDFIKFSHTKITEEYTKFLLKFILLFRKSIINSIEGQIDLSNESSKLLPDYSNDFFVFLSQNNFFDLNSDELKLEIVNLMQYFCNWLLVNGYTGSKLFLLQK